MGLRVALQHAAAGRPVFPCREKGGPAQHERAKSPYIKDWRRRATIDADTIRQWWAKWPHALVGVPTGDPIGRVFVLDVDVHDGAMGPDSLAELETQHGKLPDTVEAITATGGRHLYFSYPPAADVRNSSAKLGLGLDIRGTGGYVIAPGSRMADGRAYEWEGSSDPDEGAKVAAAPLWLLELITPPRDTRIAPPTVGTGDGFVRREDVESALLAIDPDLDYESWARVGMALESTGAAWAFELWHEWSATGAKYAGESEMRAKWLSFDSTKRGRPHGPVRVGALFAIAKAAGWQRPVRKSEGPLPPAPPGAGDDNEPPDQGGPSPARIELRAGELAAIVDRAMAGLASAGLGIYRQATRLVRIGQPEQGRGGLDRPAEAPILVELGTHHLVDYMSRALSLVKYDGRSKKYAPADPPRRLAEIALSRVDCSPFPVLRGFIEAPTLLPDGRQITERGHDERSGLFLIDGSSMPPVGEVTRRDATAGADLLYGLADTFPFVDRADESAAVAAMMTAVYRRALPAAPLIGISATTPATGKSLLADCISFLATGRRAPVMGLGIDNAEAEKRLGVVLLDGDSPVSIDNIDRPLKSDMLCRIATQPSEDVRVLGFSRKVTAPTNVCFLLTGNNLTLLGDLVRRVLLIRLDAGWECPELRPIPRNAIEHMRTYRAAALRAILTISKAYRDAGAPDVGTTPFGSFETWDRMVRRPLVWAGMADPLKAAQTLRDEDHELVAIGELFNAWWGLYGEQPKIAAEIITDATARGEYGGSLVNPELADAVGMVLGSDSKMNAQVLARRFRVWQRRTVRGYRLYRFRRDSTRGILWAMERRNPTQKA